MNDHRCPKCNKLLMAMTDSTGRTELRCLKCDQVDPMKTHAAKVGRQSPGWTDERGQDDRF
jgi:phage FluMu protein Com